MRLRAVDSVVDTVNSALAKQGQTLPAVERWLSEMPREDEMRAKDKYTMFDRKAKRYRKGVHSEFDPLACNTLGFILSRFRGEEMLEKTEFSPC